MNVSRGAEDVQVGQDWAGYSFLALDRHDARFIRGAGVYGFVRRRDEDRLLLFAGEADCIAGWVDASHPQWGAASVLGMNELHVFLKPRDRVERLLVLDRVVRRCEPLLNLLAARPAPEEAGPGRVVPVHGRGSV